jgi:predicted RNA-binding Zn ribbon-like protein
VSTVQELSLLGVRLCLDFANTADWHASDQPVEHLTSYAELVAWGQHARILSAQQAQRLLAIAASRSADAKAILERAIVLREAIYHLFTALSLGARPSESDLAVVNAELSGAMTRSLIVPEGIGFAWDWSAEDALDRMLWPVVQDAADLLTGEDLSRVGRCADDNCGWLFFDTSRNHSRRWCSMKDCGNRAKARRHYRKTTSSQA